MFGSHFGNWKRNTYRTCNITDRKRKEGFVWQVLLFSFGNRTKKGKGREEINFFSLSVLSLCFGFIISTHCTNRRLKTYFLLRKLLLRGAIVVNILPWHGFSLNINLEYYRHMQLGWMLFSCKLTSEESRVRLSVARGGSTMACCL